MMAWLLAFVVHSTLWLGLAWLATRLAPGLHPRTRETIWYTAIAASLIGPSFLTFAPGAATSLWHLHLPVFVSSFRGVESLGTRAGGSPVTDASRLGVESLLIGTWLLVAAVLLLRHIVQLMAYRRRLARRDFAHHDPEAVALRQVWRQARFGWPPRLTHSENLGSPIAMGVRAKAEVCVPTRSLPELGTIQFRAMLSHEIAHHVRRDPIRLGVMNVLRTVLFFQPLLSVARRAVGQAAEEQCDAWAARHVQDPLAVARCLTEVAGWVLPRDRRIAAIGMMRGRSQLVRRVDRLMAQEADLGGGWRTLRRLGAMSLLFVVPWLAPGLDPAESMSAKAASSALIAPESAPYQLEGGFGPFFERGNPAVQDDDRVRDSRGEHDGEMGESRQSADDHHEDHGTETRDPSDHDEGSIEHE